MIEKEHLVNLLNTTKNALEKKDSVTLKEISDMTIHSATSLQDSGSITLAVILYSLSKLIERKDYNKISKWSQFEKKMMSYISLAIDTLKKDNLKIYEDYLLKSRKLIESITPSLKTYIKEVVRKSEINKAYAIYRHGISLGQTANLLGVSQWELSDYVGQKHSDDHFFDKEIAKKRANLALNFFS